MAFRRLWPLHEGESRAGAVTEDVLRVLLLTGKHAAAHGRISEVGHGSRPWSACVGLKIPASRAASLEGLRRTTACHWRAVCSCRFTVVCQWPCILSRTDYGHS